MTQNTIDAITAKQEATRLKLRKLKDETAILRAETEAYYKTSERFGHPWVNWMIAQLQQLNQWLVGRGWAPNGLDSSKR